MTSAIRARGIRKSFGPVEVLRGIDLDVAEGEVLGLIGPSGSGKSTFLRCLDSLETIDDGDLRVNGEIVGHVWEGGRLRRMGDRALAEQRRGTGMVFQRFNLFAHMTALENVVCGPVHVLRQGREAARAAGRAHLARVGLADFCDRYPAELSGGQQQRVAIARAIAMEPRILLFDEPTSALDPELVDEVLATMRDLAAQGRTMVVVTHELAFARDVCDRVAFLDGGRVVETASARAFFAAPGHPRTRDFLQRLHAV